MERFLMLLSALTVCGALAAFAQESLPSTHPKYQAAQRVYTDLVRAIGDGRPPPRLYMRPQHVVGGERIIAWFDPLLHIIGIDEQVYDVCAARHLKR